MRTVKCDPSDVLFRPHATGKKQPCFLIQATSVTLIIGKSGQSDSVRRLRSHLSLESCGTVLTSLILSHTHKDPCGDGIVW